MCCCIDFHLRRTVTQKEATTQKKSTKLFWNACNAQITDFHWISSFCLSHSAYLPTFLIPKWKKYGKNYTSVLLRIGWFIFHSIIQRETNIVIGRYKGNSCHTWQRALEDFAWLQTGFLSQPHRLKLAF